MALEELEDNKLIALTQKGNPAAFGVLVKRYMERAYYIALGFVGSHDDALDLSQEAFVRAFKAIRRFESGRKFFTWYYQILRNLCLNFIRDRKKRAYKFSEVAEYEILQLKSDDSLRPDEMVEKEELKEKFWQALAALPERDREILMLREFHDMSYQELAEMLGCPIGTIMSRLYHARKHLANALKDRL